MHERSLMLIGLRGVGKTVLLNRIGGMAEAAGFSLLALEATEGRTLPELLAPAMRGTLYRLDAVAGASDRVRRGFRVLRGFLGALKVKVGGLEVTLDVDPERGTADSGDLEADLPELFVVLAEAAQDRTAAIAITIDELQYVSEAEMRALIMAMHRISQRRLPILLVAAGLPQLVALAGKAKSYAERLFEYPEIGPLSQDDARTALQEPVQRLGVRFTEDAIREIVRATHGYPYFLQEWGYRAWDLAPMSPIDVDVVRAATTAAITRLDASFFRVRLDRLTPREKEYLRALADLGPGPHRSGEVADRLGVKVESVAPTRSALIRKGMVYGPDHGVTAFTVPLFNEFMLRTMPELKLKTKPAR